MSLLNVLLAVAALATAPVALLACLIKPRWRRGLGSRLGLGWPRASSAPTLWAHAASVGEIEGIVPLVQRWHTVYPQGRILVTALTTTGCDVAQASLPFADARVFPIDLPGISPRVVRRLRPDLYLFSENEIWPNVLSTMADTGVPAIQVSGRISPLAAKTLGRLPSLSAYVLGRVTRYCVQTDADRERLLQLGVERTRVICTGSLKGDGRPAPVADFLEDVGATERPVIVVGSTHEGEEEEVVAAMHLFERQEPSPLWILAPRHPERFGSIASLLERNEVAYVRRSRLPAAGEARRAALGEVGVLLLDTVGELAGCFRAATVCFVGGSLAPIGGHNLLEPARCGIPIVVGPHLDSVRELADRLEAANVVTVVNDAAQLARALHEAIERAPDARTAQAARAVAAQAGGSLERTWACLVEVGVVPEEASS